VTTIAVLTAAHAEALKRFFGQLPDKDVTSVKEDVRDPANIDAAIGDTRAWRWVALDDEGDVIAYASLLPGVGLSGHVGELRLVVSRRHRRQGLGRAMAQTVLLAALTNGLSKVMVEVPADHESTAEVFRRLGFEGEALLRDHVRERNGQLSDLLVLAHFADENSSILAGLGVEEPASPTAS
jgi:RimJ/RimL family protein N-acetyltransferase